MQLLLLPLPLLLLLPLLPLQSKKKLHRKEVPMHQNFFLISKNDYKKKQHLINQPLEEVLTQK
jgi:hypothetical protein